jgi:hypothetical protein
VALDGSPRHRVKKSPRLAAELRPELGQLSAHPAAGVAIEDIAEGFIQNAQVPDLHRSARCCHPDGAYPPGYPPVCGRRFSAQIRSQRGANFQVSASQDRSRPKRDLSRACIHRGCGTQEITSAGRRHSTALPDTGSKRVHAWQRNYDGHAEGPLSPPSLSTGAGTGIYRHQGKFSPPTHLGDS